MTVDWSYSIPRSSGYGLETTNAGTDREYVDGYVVTPHGVVLVYSQFQPPWTSYRFVWGGRMYHHREGRYRTKRGLTCMAGRFARFVATTYAP
jgi:hypothetical protein